MNKELISWLKNLHEGAAARVAAGWQPTPTNAREALAAITDGFGPKEQPCDLEQDWLIQTERAVSVRIYRSGEQPQPLIIFAHGGGHVAGSVTVYNNICRRIARESGAMVMSVDYRLAPECPYPMGIDDVYSVLKNCLQPILSLKLNHDGRIFLMGDSGGGAAVSSAAICNSQSNSPSPLDGLILVYPSVDYRMQHPSIDEKADGYMLTKGRIEWYFDQYFGLTTDRAQASPLVMLKGICLPRTLIFTSEHCPLKDEGIDFAMRAKSNGTSVQLEEVEQSIHAYLNLQDLCEEACNYTYKTISDWL